MSRYRLTFAYDQGTFSPTETYITPSTSPASAAALIQDLVNARNACLFNDVGWRGVRIAQVDDPIVIPTTTKRRSRTYPPGSYVPFVSNVPPVAPQNILTIPTGGGDLELQPQISSPDQARSAMLWTWTFDGNRTVNRYFALPPDSIIVAEPEGLRFLDYPAYANKLATLANILINGGWCVRARQTAGVGPYTIQSWIQSSPGPANVGVVLASPDATGFAQGQYVKISGVRRKGTDRTSYNGRYLLGPVITNTDGTTTIFLQGTSTGVPSSVKLPGAITKIAYAYFPVEKIEPIKGVMHKRGGSFGLVRGRSKTRISLDP